MGCFTTRKTHFMSFSYHISSTSDAHHTLFHLILTMAEALSMMPGSRAVQAESARRKLTVAPSVPCRSISASSPITPFTKIT